MIKEIKAKLRHLSKNNDTIKKIINILIYLRRRRHRLSKWLVKASENSYRCKKLVVKVATVIWWKHVKHLKREINLCFEKSLANKVSNNKYDVELIHDIIYCNLAYGFMPDEYIMFKLENKSPNKRKEFISNRDRYDYCYYLNDISDKHIFYDKFRTAEVFGDYYCRDIIKVENEKDFDAFKMFANKHSQLVLKPSSSSSGRGVRLIDVKKYETVEKLFDKIISTGIKFVVEEPIQQAKEMAVLHEYSVNTVRCPTLLTSSGVEVLHSFIKVGRNKSFIDNAGGGGIFASIHLDSGIVSTDGADKYGKFYKNHPDTNIEFKGFEIPKWDELIELVKKLAYIVPTVKYVSWDLAFTDNGWIIVEGNCHGQFICQQTSSQAGIKAQIEALIQKV